MVPAYEDCPAVVRITVGTEPFEDYFVGPIKADFGRGFKVEKIGWEVPEDEREYHVNVGGGHNNGNLCDCKGHLRWGHCKHEAGLATLVRRGLI
jgi:hypothetical protein